MTRQQKGVSLIELIIFIIVLGMLSSGILMAFAVVLEKIPAVKKTTLATTIAQRKMERILGQKYSQGFDNVSDPCETQPQPDICENVPVGYQIDQVDITQPWNGDNHHKAITVTVKTEDGSQVLSSLRTIVADY
jgi:Tfp pilus assembly protein PilE